MKKTIIALLALAGMTSAIELTDAEFVLDTATSSKTVEYEDYEATLSMELKVDKLASALTLNSAETSLISWVINGTTVKWNTNITESTTGFKTVMGTTNRSLIENTADGHHLADGFESITWDKITGAALTIVLNDSSGTKTCGFLTLRDNANNYSEYYAADKGLGWSNGTLTNISITNTDLVSKVYVYNSAFSMGNAQANNQKVIAAAIPEPTTAALSLLALAGLATRRRRK